MKKTIGLLLMFSSLIGTILFSLSLVKYRSCSDLDDLIYLKKGWVNRFYYYQYEAIFNGDKILLYGNSEMKDNKCFFVKEDTIDHSEKNKKDYRYINNIVFFVFIRISLLMLAFFWGVLLLVKDNREIIRNLLNERKNMRKDRMRR